MKVACVYSSNIEPLFVNFAASLNAALHGIELKSLLVDLPIKPTITGFQSDIWYSMIRHQISHTLEIMEHFIHEGDYLVSCDVDIHFFRPEALSRLVDEAKSNSIDFMALEDRPFYYNTGFIILRKSGCILDLYRRTLTGLADRRLPFADQDEINHLLPALDIKHLPIPPQLGTLGQQPIHESTIFYHATAAHDLDAKLLRIRTAQSQMQNRTFGVWQDH